MYRRNKWTRIGMLAVMCLLFLTRSGEAQHVQAQEEPYDGWLSYTSEKGGYFFDYPPVSFDVIEGPHGVTVLRPDTASGTDGDIIFEYLAYELDDVTDDLVAWFDLYIDYHGEPIDPKASRAVIARLQKAESQQAIIETPVTSPIYVYGYLFTNGKVVWRLFTNSTNETDRQLVDQIAGTVQFTMHAPLSIQELYAPDPVPGISSVAEMKEFHRDSDLAKEAYRIRADTGETPAELLEQMSERAKILYELALKNNASSIQAYDARRASPPPVIEYTDEMYQSYLKSERDYANGTLVPTVDDKPRLESREFRQFLPWLSSDPSSNRSLVPSTYSGFTTSLPQPRSSDAAQALCDGAPFPTRIIDRRRGMPTRFAPPIRVIGKPIRCGSEKHIIVTGRDGYAIDIEAVIGTNVYGTTQNEYVYERYGEWTSGDGYGNLVRTMVQFDTGGVMREYHLIYAHLSSISSGVITGTSVGPSTVIAQSGNTGNVGAHLHFAIATKEGDEYYPVDLSPLKGFTPDLTYPKHCTVCAHVENHTDGHRPLIIEANEFKESYAGYTYPSHYWNCSQYWGDKHTGFCYRAAVPLAPEWGFDPINTSNSYQSPRMDYELWISDAGIYRLWVCGMGGSSDDDSLHMGVDGIPKFSADRIDGFHTSQWVWKSQTMDGPYPVFYLSTGYHDINVWARENGLRIDRVLLTKDLNFNPTTAQVRCAGEGLYP